jgi:TBC1 domain family member 20
MLHSVLSKLPKPLNLEGLISETVALVSLHPPESLSSWRSISANSVLKTSRYPSQSTSQTLKDGIRYYNKQVAELRRAELRKSVLSVMWKYRHPTGAVGVAILGVALALWLRRNGGGNSILWSGWMPGIFWRRFWR